jgi:plastocyanin
MNKGVMVAVGVALVLVAGAGWWYMNKYGGSYGATGTTETMMAQPTSSVVVEETATGGASMSKETTDEGKVRTIVVEGDKFRFNPAEIRVKQGETVRIVFKSIDMLHDFVIDEYELATNQLSAGDEEELEFVADEKGTFEYYCSVGQHRANGMVGKLIVE